MYITVYLYTVFIPLRPAGFIQDCKHFAAGFIGILLHTDAGSIRGRVLLEGGLNWNKYGSRFFRVCHLFAKLSFDNFDPSFGKILFSGSKI